jgi:hypothetical protein
VVAVSTAELGDSWLLPRPEGLFAYERVVPRPTGPAATIPLGYQPERLRLLTDQGEVVMVEFQP